MGHMALLTLLLAVVVSAKKTVFEKSEGVFILTEDNYDKGVKEWDYMLVYFFAPWCGHCKALGPEFVKAGQMLREKEIQVKLGKVDGTEEPGLMDKHGVTGYPTLKLYRKGEMVPYTGGRMAPEMVDWLVKKIGPPARPLTSLQEVESFVSDHEVGVVGFFSEEGSEEHKAYILACRDYDDYGVHYPVAVTTDKEAGEHFGVKDKVVLFKKFDEKKVVFEGPLDTQSIRDFISENSLPVVIEFNHENAQKMFKRPNDGKSHLLVFHNKSGENYEEEMAMMAKIGKEFKLQDLLVTSVDVVEEDHRRMMEFLGVRHRINNDTFPSMRIVTMRDSEPPTRYRPEDTSVTEENLRYFVTEYLGGRVDRDYFREPLPADWDTKPVKYLTAVNFKEMVKEGGRPSLVMWYAPWCGHCKTMMPVLEKLGDKFPDLLVAKIDATVNEIPSVPSVHSFPTIKLYREDGTEAEYNGERTVEGVGKFVTTDGLFGLAAPEEPASHDEL